jgi:tRNA G26 N,N-dimethylase Trm1
MYPYRRANPIEEEKLSINRIVSNALRPQTVLEPFAGDGTSTRIFARYAGQLIAIEKNPTCVTTFSRNFNSRKISLIANDNIRILPLLASHSFELVDLDPCGSCYDQIGLCARLLTNNGVLLLSSGEIQRVVRGLKLARFAESRDYKGRDAALWAQDVWIPYVRRLLASHGCKVRLLHFFTSPVLVRVVLACSQNQIDFKMLKTRPRYLGWFEQVIAERNLETQPRIPKGYL